MRQEIAMKISMTVAFVKRKDTREKTYLIRMKETQMAITHNNMRKIQMTSTLMEKMFPGIEKTGMMMKRKRKSYNMMNCSQIVRSTYSS